MTDRFILLREPGRMLLHIPAPDDDSSTLCGEPTDEMDAIEVKATTSVIVCGACTKRAVG